MLDLGLARRLAALTGADASPPRFLDLEQVEGGVAVHWDGADRAGYEIALYSEQGRTVRYFRSVRPGHRIAVGEGSHRIRVRSHGIFGLGRNWSPEIFFVLAEGPHSDAPELRISRKRGMVPRPKAFFENVALIRDEIEGGSTRLQSFPIALSLILEGRGCNFKCFYCSHIIDDAHMLLGPENTFTKGFTFERGQVLRVNRVQGETVGAPRPLIDEIKTHLPHICTIMFGGSEPLLYPEFKEVVALTQDYPHVQCSVCTNGSLLHQELAEYIVRSNFPWIRISIDGATAKTFRKIRKGKFEKVIGNIRNLVTLRGERVWPKVQFNFVVCRSSYHEIAELVDLAADIGVDLINYKMLIVHPGELGRVMVEEDPVTDRGMCVEIIDLMNEAARIAEQKGVALSKEAVSPAIFARHPDLADPAVQAEVRRSEAKAIAARARARAEDADDTGPQTLADYAKTLDEWHLVAAGSRYHRKTPQEIAAMAAPEPGRSPQRTPPGQSSAAQNDLMTTLLEDEEAAEEEGLQCHAPPAKSGTIDWNKVFCHLPFTNLSVGHNRAKFCCYAKQPYTAFYAGDDLTVADIWNNPRFVEARELMYGGRADLVCKPTCPHLRHNGLKSTFFQESAGTGTHKRMNGDGQPQQEAKQGLPPHHPGGTRSAGSRVSS